MPPIDLTGLHRVQAKGRTYIYAWRGGPRLRSEPGSQAFVRELAEAQASRDNRKQGDRSRLSGLCAAYRASDDWKGLADKTRVAWAPWLDRIQDRFGDLRLAQFERPLLRPRIRQWHQGFKATPRAADMGKQVFSRLLSFGVAEGMLALNLVEGLPNLYSSDRADLIWTPDDMAELARRAPAEVLYAARLAALSGLRKSDLLRLTWAHVKPHSIEIATGKSRRRKTTIIPIYAELRALLGDIQAFRQRQRAAVVARWRRRGAAPPPEPMTILTSSQGRPWAGGFGASWNRVLKNPDGTAWTDLHFHDFRGTAATRMYLGGLTPREIAAMFTWSETRVDQMLDTYVRKDEILLDRIRRLDDAANRDAQ